MLHPPTRGTPKEIAACTAPGQAASEQSFKGGVTTVFDLVPIDPARLAAINEVNPAFQPAYDARRAAQRKLWAEYQDPNPTLRVLVQGSDAANGKGGDGDLRHSWLPGSSTIGRRTAAHRFTTT